MGKVFPLNTIIVNIFLPHSSFEDNPIISYEEEEED